MLSRKTVFILGAGASKEVGLPIGSELIMLIADKLNIEFDGFSQQIRRGDHAVILQALRKKYPQEISKYHKACRQIGKGVILSKSIDDFLNNHQHDEAIVICSKLGIAKSIGDAERQSSLYFARTNIYNTIDFTSPSVLNTWYTRFYQLITTEVPIENLGSLFENVSVISFNYDRCLEHFLVQALSQNYLIPLEESQNLVQKLTILHPCGSVGSYLSPRDKVIEFGFEDTLLLDEMIANIKTYTEQIEQNGEVQRIREEMHQAETLVFLGMAFHENNMALLQSKPSTKARKIYATRKGISESDLPVVRKRITALWEQDSENIFLGEECKDLFAEYQMSLGS